MLAGNLASIGVGGIIACVTSYLVRTIDLLVAFNYVNKLVFVH